MNRRKDILADALAQLKQEGQSQSVPKEVLDQILERISDFGLRTADSGTHTLPIRNRQSAIRRLGRLAAAAAVLVLAGYAAGRLSAPEPMSLEQLHDALAPSLAASIEPAIRERLIEDMRRQYQLALANTYVHLKEELTQQYREDLNRYAMQTLAASNAVTNELLAGLMQTIDTAKAQDLRRIAQTLYEIERNRVQDKEQLASGLQTLAYRTEGELARTKRQIAQLLIDVRPEAFEPILNHDERNE
jgi:hypothetical protein